MSLFEDVFREARELDANFSDVIVHAGQGGARRVVRTEAQGIVELPAVPATQADWLAATKLLIPAADIWQRFEAEGDIDFSLEYQGDLMRICVSRAERRLSYVMRQRRGDPPSLEKLGLPTDVTPWLARTNGLILVCGATGAGKSTTLAAMIQHINETRAGHFVTIEDPIEYLFKPKKCVFTQRAVGVDVSSFARGVRAAMRQSPQFLLVGEIRDAETLEATLQLGESGQLVLATMHATNCERALERVEALAGSKQELVRSQLAGSLVGIVAQTLLPTVNGNRALAAEVLHSTPGVSAAIRGGKVNDLRTIMRNPPTGEKHVRMAASLAGLVRGQWVDRMVARGAAYDAPEYDAQVERQVVPMPLGRNPNPVGTTARAHALAGGAL